jgi:rare lipoprotein A
MRPRQCAASGTFALALLIGGFATGRAQAQNPSVSDFESRFHFQQNMPAEPGQPAAPQHPPNPLKELFISPAEAVPAPLPDAVPPTQQSESNEKTETLPGKAAGLRQPAAEKRLAIGRAAYYEHPGRTASGEKYDPDGLTAAHRTLALGTRLRIVNLRNRKSVVVRVNDRSPAKMKYAIDLSRGSANAIGITKRGGTGLVAIYKLEEQY